MEIIKLDYKILVFLYAYLRQVDLSLDRVRWVSVGELREYYKDQIPPKKVADYLFKKMNLSPDELREPCSIGTIKFPTKLKVLFIRWFRNESFMTKDEGRYCCQKLIVLDQYLNNDAEVDKIVLERLRIEIVELVYDKIKLRLSLKDRNRGMLIEHFLQNDRLRTLKMEEFTTGLDL